MKPLLPLVHNQLFSFADVDMEVVVLAPDIRALTSSCLIVACDQPDNSHVVCKLNAVFELWVATQLCIKYRRGLSRQSLAEQGVLRGASIESQDGECGGAYPYCLGSAHQEFTDPVTEGSVKP